MQSPWPSQWTALDELYGPLEWTVTVAQSVSQAERAYEIWLHWHENRVMVVDAHNGIKNRCPLCPWSWGDTFRRFQVGPELRPFADEDEALAHLLSWIRDRSLGRWLISFQIMEELSLQPQTRLLRGDPHSTLARLLERLSHKAPPGFRFCGHQHERELSIYKPIPILVPWWSVSSDDSMDPCPLCSMGLPTWSLHPTQSDSLPEDADAPDNGDLWRAVHEVHEHGVHLWDPDDMSCPDCREVSQRRQGLGPQEPLEYDSPAF
ncbi:MAG: hypothetical protein C7B46_08260 [Sulfobacillus benefaciens]|uniref:Uncharacterized protein n=1 Tax=Sulfobacillus benefaciens TaxID=453960 RepID=A0A2T2XH60_9FIRM|nr:MAG: hypothetical protein C7B46_08260 [Sulfobacillus benefaciens]